MLRERSETITFTRDDVERLVRHICQVQLSGGHIFVGKFGEKGAVEFTTVVAFWSFWALFLNATGAGSVPR